MEMLWDSAQGDQSSAKLFGAQTTTLENWRIDRWERLFFSEGFFPPNSKQFYVPPQTQAMSLGAGRGTTTHKNTPKVCFRTGSKAVLRAEITLWFTRLILLLSVGHNPSNPPCQLWSRFHNSKFPGVTADVSYLECVYIYTSRWWKHGPLLFLSDLGAAPPQGTVKILRLRDGVDWGGGSDEWVVA